MWRTFECSELDPTLSGDNLVTKMNEKIRSRLPKPDWKKILKRISKSDKVAIAKEYDKRLKKENRENILEHLALKWDRSTRRIEAYISEGRQIITHEKQAAESKRIQRDVLKEQVKKHFDGLAEVAKTLHDVQQYILSYGRDESFTVIESAGIAGFFSFQPPPKKQPVLSAFAGSGVAVDYPEAEYFLQHLLQEFPDLGLKEWQGLVKSRLPKDVIDRLRYLGNTAEFTYCSNCQVCKDLMA